MRAAITETIAVVLQVLNVCNRPLGWLTDPLEDWLLRRVESLFPPVPLRTQVQVEAAGGRWQPASVYYKVLEFDASRRLMDRWHAVLCLDRKRVSWWRRRRQYLERCGDDVVAV